jgi:hypothetical protein
MVDSGAELRGRENVVLQQMERDDMATDSNDDRRAAGTDPSRRKGSPARPSPPSGPPIQNGGLESLRSHDC